MKKTFTILLLLLLLTTIHPVAAQGHVYYVDLGGSDTTGDGSSGNPWASIRFAASQVQADDLVLINPGVYEGGVIVETDGTASEPIIFRANGEGVVIEGSGGERDAFFINDSDYIIVEGITIQHAERAGLRISLGDSVIEKSYNYEGSKLPVVLVSRREQDGMRHDPVRHSSKRSL
jgi:hypothetical protein